MVDLERKRGEGGEEDKPRTGSITDASTVKITGVLGLGFIPNQHKSRKKTRKTKQPTDPALIKHKKNLNDAS
jgi:hypothetical protein